MNVQDEQTGTERSDTATWIPMTPGLDPVPAAADLNVVFRTQPRPVQARHRVAYRTALLVLVLASFNRGAASFVHLHTVMWATRSSRTRQMFIAWWSGRRVRDTATDRFDPDLQVTLNLALVDELVQLSGNRQRVRLTDKGRGLADLINDDSELLAVDKSFLGKLSHLSDAEMQRKLGQVSQ